MTTVTHTMGGEVRTTPNVIRFIYVNKNEIIFNKKYKNNLKINNLIYYQ